MKRTEQRARDLERRAESLETKLDEERVASASTLDEAVTIVEEWQGRAYDAMRRVDDQKVLARRARDLARMLRTVDPRAAASNSEPTARTATSTKIVATRRRRGKRNGRLAPIVEAPRRRRYALDREVEGGATVGGLLKDAEDKLLAALVAEERAALEADAPRPEPAKPDWLPRFPWGNE